MKFKVDDWVEVCDGGTYSNHIYTITKYLKKTKYFNARYNLKGFCKNVLEKEIKLWQPKKDEWCWFISVNDTYELLKFVKLLQNGKYQARTKHGVIFNYSICEPFIGTLPKHIKKES